MSTDLCELNLHQVKEAYKNGNFSCKEYVDALIKKSETHKDLNALVSTDWESLRVSAENIDTSGHSEKQLSGVPLCFKANINTAQLPTCAATGALAKHVSTSPAPVAKSLFESGALLGATGNMHELAFGITSNNSVTGPVRNPWNKSMIPGGSSGGVAAAVSAGMMPAGIGTDTGASVRLPAALCGVVGFRPTVGRYSGQGIVPISHTRDTAGPITRSVPDAILLDRVMCSGSEESSNTSLKGLRLGVPREYFYDDLDPDVAVASEKVLSLLQAEGVHLVEEDINGIGDMNNAVSFPIALYEFISDLPKYLTENKLNFSMQDICNDIGSPDVKGLFESLLGEGAMPESVYKEAIESGRPKLQEAFREYFANQSVDAIIFPTSPLTARPIGQDETVELNGVQQPTFPTFIRNTDPSSNAGIPGISLPISVSSSGLPIGIELDAPVGRDDRLLSIAKELEKVFEFSARPQL